MANKQIIIHLTPECFHRVDDINETNKEADEFYSEYEETEGFKKTKITRKEFLNEELIKTKIGYAYVYVFKESNNISLLYLRTGDTWVDIEDIKNNEFRHRLCQEDEQSYVVTLDEYKDYKIFSAISIKRTIFLTLYKD